MGVKMNFRIITKNHEADAVIGFLTKSISKPFDRSKAIPPAWELRSQDLKKKMTLICEPLMEIGHIYWLIQGIGKT